MSVPQDRAKSIFLNAAEIPALAERQAYVAAACGADDALRREVEDLLRHHGHVGDFLESPCAPALGKQPASDAILGEYPNLTSGHAVGFIRQSAVREGPGTVIGPYKLLEQIGEGGMGAVWMAEQRQPIRRKVALKIIKPGMDSRQVIARFEAERQALALMDHPNIARVLDAGATQAGRPFFVMELVRGLPITDYCDQHDLPVRQRLGLFFDVCQAVQHAHQKGIIHRDLKPSNVLIAPYDGRPVAKVIDFGIAKAMGQRLTDKTLFTNFAQLIGTPLYMSPEQAELSGVDIDTRSDIYSLGALLYELLTGSPPFDTERLKTAGYDEIRRIIREEEPVKPSTRIRTLGQAGAKVSGQRKSDPQRLSRVLRRELDWIVMKCLEKDRKRRYETANALAADVQHYLADQPVQVCPPTVGYRVQKLWRRNRGLVSATAIVLLCLLGGIVGTSWGLVRALQAESQARREAGAARAARGAEREQRTFAEKEKARAEENLKQARAAVDKLFTRVAENLANKPQMAQIRRALLVDALDFYKGFLAQKGTDPEMRLETARAYGRVGDIQEMLGNGAEAEAALRQAMVLMEKLVADFPDVRLYREELTGSRKALAFRLLWGHKHQECADLRRRLLVDSEKLAADFPTVPEYQRRLAYAHTDLGNALRDALGQLPQAERHLRQAVAVWKKLAATFPKEPPDRFGVSHSHLWLGALLLTTSRLAEAEPELQQAVAIRERLSAEAPNDPGLKAHLAHAQNYLADLLLVAGQPNEAARYYQRAVALREKLRADFPDDAENQRRLSIEYVGLGRALLALGRTHEAEGAFRQGLMLAKKQADAHPGVLPYPRSLAWRYFALGLLLHQTKRPQDAADAFGQAQKLFEATAAKFPDDPNSQGSLAWFLSTCPAPQFRDATRAVEAAKRAVQRRATLRDDWLALGIAQYRAGSWQAAVEALTKATEFGQGGDRAEWFFLAMAHWQLSDKKEGRRRYQQAVEWMEKHQPGNDVLRRFRNEAAQLLGLISSEP
jgi:serine/threonine protein kinase/tetratricopeptide (TPR) repeat protein